MSEPFHTRQRLKAARLSVRQSEDFGHKDEDYRNLLKFFEDIVTTLADQRPDDPNGAKAFVIRTMGVIVGREANSAYKPFGYKNPFLAIPQSDQAASKPEAPRWAWPVINDPPTSPGGRFGGEFRAFSALKLFGYTVGKTDGWPVNRRQQFLSDFMERSLPNIVEATFDDDYGAPMTTTRLRKVANVIASNAGLRYRNDPHRYRQAIQDWEADLEFLKSKYYLGHGLQFQPWPDPRD